MASCCATWRASMKITRDGEVVLKRGGNLADGNQGEGSQRRGF